MTDELRINATDLARLIGERDDYERAHEKLLEKTSMLDAEWRAERDEYREKLHRFHRAIQEVLGWDQAALVPERQLFDRIRHLVTYNPGEAAVWNRIQALEPVEHPAAHSTPSNDPIELTESGWMIDDLIEVNSNNVTFRARLTRAADPALYPDGGWWAAVVTERLDNAPEHLGPFVGAVLMLRESSDGPNRRVGGLGTPSPAYVPDRPTEAPAEAIPEPAAAEAAPWEPRVFQPGDECPPDLSLIERHNATTDDGLWFRDPQHMVADKSIGATFSYYNGEHWTRSIVPWQTLLEELQQAWEVRDEPDGWPVPPPAFLATGNPPAEQPEQQ